MSKGAREAFGSVFAVEQEDAEIAHIKIKKEEKLQKEEEKLLEEKRVADEIAEAERGGGGPGCESQESI